MLAVLMKGGVVTIDDLRAEMTTPGKDGSPLVGTIRSHVCKLREKLPDCYRIVPLRGVGYRLEKARILTATPPKQRRAA